MWFVNEGEETVRVPCALRSGQPLDSLILGGKVTNSFGVTGIADSLIFLPFAPFGFVGKLT